ncbi:ABC transporter permease subunit [Gordonia sp. TBRC 11910]|uniref:ABC transporter permease subunit n=1 Tax=Gordonia asplenii TaxID=2725283 RepID=A0A848KYY1_9ACTN|nr:ABC transporter permease subunit [Gordonia asplenii]NMO02055.1 ABC transporter permease subunit [Gordonia asplenii]
MTVVDTRRRLTSPEAVRERSGGVAADILILVGAIALIWVIVRISQGMNASVNLSNAPTSIDTNPAKLPYYAARSLLRMFIGLGLSLIFTFVYATIAARSRRARIVLLPVLDILQSVPILGFLSITVTMFIALFPGSELGLESAAIFAIFTSQAWNMTFAFYQSLTSQPRDLTEAAVNLRLSRWQRFWRLDVPSGMIPLVWNSMMSFGGAWFFLTASEAVSVSGKSFALPGIGAYVASASSEGDLGDVWWAIITMIIVVVVVNFAFWSPLTAWAERFRVENSASGREPKSLVLNLLRRSHAAGLANRLLDPVTDVCDRAFGVLGGRTGPPPVVHAQRRRIADVLFALAVAALLGYTLYRIVEVILGDVGLHEVGYTVLLGCATMARIVVVMIVCTAIWVPIGVLIGLNPKLSRMLQPVIQVCASFPANFLFPIVTAVFLALHIGLDVGGIVLMALGTQWYILFNVIAGASAIPNDLLEASADMRLSRSLRWRKVLLPAIFASYVTGGITAAGGAWNASIVAEIITYNGQTYNAHGLGNYIAQWTASTAPDHWAHLLLGICVMCAFVVATNAVFWRRLYALAERRYTL